MKKNKVVYLNEVVSKKYETEKLPEHIATLEKNITSIKERIRKYQTTLVKMEEDLRTVKEELPK
jgi:septal ring factor EnvC (AmiA/AmiB activator)